MNKSELKEKAINALSESGYLYQNFNYKEALQAAEEAWNAYFELQKMRSEDEDFTDLIYAARAQYQKCKAALENEPEEPTEEQEFQKIMALKERADKGDALAALDVAQYFYDSDNWPLLDEQGMESSEYLPWTAKAFNHIVNNTDIPMNVRVFASHHLGSMFLLPKYGQVDMECALRCYKWAADNFPEGDKAIEWLLHINLERVVETAMYLGQVQTAAEYAQKSIEKGGDRGIFFHIAYYGYRHDQSMSDDMIDFMLETNTWQGLLLKGIELMNKGFQTNWEDNEVIEELDKHVYEKMSVYYDENSETEGGYACLGFCLYKMLVFNGLDLFNQFGEHIEYLFEGVEENYPWCHTYYGIICDNASYLYKNAGDEEKAQALSKEAEKHLCIAAHEGNRLALKDYCFWLIDNNAEPALIENYKKIAKQYDISI